MMGKSDPQALIDIKSETSEKLEVWCEVHGARNAGLILIATGCLLLPITFIFTIHEPEFRYLMLLGIVLIGIGLMTFRKSPRPFVTFRKDTTDLSVHLGERAYPMTLSENPFEAKVFHKKSSFGRNLYYIRIHGRFLNKPHVDLLTNASSIELATLAAAFLDGYRHGSKWMDRRYIEAVRIPKQNWKRDIKIVAAVIAGTLLIIFLITFLPK